MEITMGQSIAIEWALKEWGEPYGFSDWEHTVQKGVYGQVSHTYSARTRFGALTIRFTDLLVRRDLGAKLVAEMETHLVGRMARQGKWHVHALTTGHDVKLTFGEDVALERATDSSERVSQA
jgi:hypothetical protein